MANYITTEEAQVYLDDRLHTDAWDEASDTDRTKAIAMATRIIDTLNFAGSKTASDQANEFPRGGDLSVPQSVKDAVAEIALALLDGVDPQLEADNLHLMSQGFSQIKSTYNTDIARPHVIAGVPSRTAWILLQPYLRDPRKINVYRV